MEVKGAISFVHIGWPDDYLRGILGALVARPACDIEHQSSVAYSRTPIDFLKRA